MVFTEINKKELSKLPFMLNSICDCTKQGTVDRPNGFDYHQFIWVIKGGGNFKIGNENYFLSEGEGIFTRVGIPQQYGGNGDCLHTAWFTFSMSEEALDSIGVGEALRFNVPSFLGSETRQLISFANGDSTPLTRSAAGYSYAVELFSAILSEDQSIADRIYHILEQRYSEPLTLSDISDAMSMDKFALCRSYKSERGSTVMDELNRIRIKKAKQFLKYNVGSVNKICKMCGFESPSYFCKRFREAVGCTPSEYRQRHL